MEWRGTEKAERKGEWLEKWLRGYAELEQEADQKATQECDNKGKKSMTRTYQGFKSGSIDTLGDMQTQVRLGDNYLIITKFQPKLNKGATTIHHFADMSVFLGEVKYSKNEFQGMLLEAKGYFSYQIADDGSVKEDGRAYRFEPPVENINGNVDNFATSVLFRFKGYDYDPADLTENSPSLDRDDPNNPWKMWNTPITQKRTAIEKSIFNQYVPRGWGEAPLSLTAPEDNPSTEKPGEDQDPIINAPTKFKVKNIDKITNFTSSADTLEIDTDSFGISSSATFTAGKNKKVVKKKLAQQDFDFLYDEKKGGL